MQYSTNLETRLWGAQLGDSNDDIIDKLSLSANNKDLVAVGTSTGTAMFSFLRDIVGHIRLTLGSDTHTNVWLMKLTSDDGALSWEQTMDGPRDALATGIALDLNGDIIVSGQTITRQPSHVVEDNMWIGKWSATDGL